MNNGKGNILIHARGMMIPEETSFWQRLRYSLNDLGFELWLIGHHYPNHEIDFPLLKVRNHLDGVTYSSNNQGWSPWIKDFSDLDDEALLERERLWCGQEKNEFHIEKRRRALSFYKNFYTATLKLLEPKLVLIWNGHHPQEMILEQLARNSGCPVLYIERSPFASSIQIDAQGVLAGTAIAKQQHWTWTNDDDVHHWHKVMKNLQNQYQCNQSTWWEQPKTVGKNRIIKKLKIPNNKKIVLFAGQVDEDIQNFLFSPLFKSNIDAYSWLCKQLENNHSIFILGKHHPKSTVPVEHYQKITPSNGVWTDQLSLKDCFALADRVVAVNSTVLFEALMTEKPILSMGDSLLSGKDIAYEVNELWSDHSVISSWLAAEDFPRRLERWLDFGAYLVANNFYTMRPPTDDEGQRGAKKLAQDLVCLLTDSTQVIDYKFIDFDASLFSFLELATQYDDLKRKAYGFEYLKKVISIFPPRLSRKIHTLAKQILN